MVIWAHNAHRDKEGGSRQGRRNDSTGGREDARGLGRVEGVGILIRRELLS